VGHCESLLFLTRAAVKRAIEPLKVFDLCAGLVCLPNKGSLLPCGIRIRKIAPLHQVQRINTSWALSVELSNFLPLKDCVLKHTLYGEAITEQPRQVRFTFNRALSCLKARHKVGSKLESSFCSRLRLLDLHLTESFHELDSWLHGSISNRIVFSFYRDGFHVVWDQLCNSLEGFLCVRVLCVLGREFR
jgi:hypothetical protein